MTQKENSWEEEFDEKIRWLIESFINSSDQKMYREEFIKDISDLLSQARREVMEEMAIEEIKSMELAVKEERQKVVEWAKEHSFGYPAVLTEMEKVVSLSDLIGYLNEKKNVI